MKKFPYLSVLVFLFFMFFSFSAKSACWVFSYSSQQWYYFGTLCCNQFAINWELGDQCYNSSGCNVFSGGGGEESTELGKKEGQTGIHPSLSSLTKICKYEIILDGSGNGTIFYGQDRVAVLTEEGLHVFFSMEACFYVSNEVKMQVIDGKVVPMDVRLPTSIATGGKETNSQFAVPLGKLKEEQIEMIKRISQPVLKEVRQKYNLNVMPNPATEEITLRFESSKDQKATMTFINIFGSQLFRSEKNATIGQNAFTFDVKDYNPGTYFILLEIDGVNLSQEVIKG